MAKQETLDAISALAAMIGDKDTAERISQLACASSIDAGLASAFTEVKLKQFFTNDTETLALKDTVRELSRENDPVLISGETGTGKELLALALCGKGHDYFVPINVTGLPAELIESELFGHVKGAFTGAVTTRDGLFTSARDGVLFLDEIGDMPLVAQAKLLRVLQERKLRKVGSNEHEEIRCRLVAATNRNVAQMVESGTFREDLYWRLSTFQLSIKPLRERTCDILGIVKLLAPKQSTEWHTKVEQFILSNRPSLRGNVREVQQIVRRFEVFGES